MAESERESCEPSVVEPESEQQQLGEKLSQMLHDRARSSSQELHKTLLSFSAATLAVYFISLTGHEEAASTPGQTAAALIGLFSMGLATFAGLLAFYSDMKRNYYRGSALQEPRGAKRESLFQLRAQWLQRMRLSVILLNSGFSLGVIASIVYLALRIVNK